MRFIHRRHRWIIQALLATCFAAAAMSVARAQTRPPLVDIPGQDAARGLVQCGEQSRRQRLCDSDAVQQIPTRAVRGQLRVSEAQQKQALYAYQQTIQTAFGEVENSLVDQAKTREQLAAQQRQVGALDRYAQIARERYDNGYTSYIEVLDAERSLFQAQLQLTQTQGQLHFALINLYKALGGGWVDEAEKLAPGPGVDTGSKPPLFP